MTYKTAHCMMKKIRIHLMTDEDERPLRGDVEVDETAWAASPANGTASTPTLPPARAEKAAPRRLQQSDRARHGRAWRQGPRRRHRIPARRAA
jgi:hypothetical protein